MESTSQYDESRPGATLPGVVGHQGTAAGSGSSQKSLSITTDNAQTKWKNAPNGDKDTDRNTEVQESIKGDNLEQKPRNSATSGNNEATPDEANAHFFKYLQQTYKLSKDLDAEIIAAPNTKREIKALIKQLSNNVKGLIQWGRHTGKVCVPTSSRGNQTDVDKDMGQVEAKTTGAQTCATKENAASAGQVPEVSGLSSDRSRYEIPAAIEGLRQMLKAQGEVVGKLAEQVERIQTQHQQQKPPKQQQQRDPQDQGHQQLQQQQTHTGLTQDPPQSEDNVNWETVKKKRKQKKKKKERKRPEPRTRPDVFIVKAGVMKYSEMLKKIKVDRGTIPGRQH